MFQTFATRVQHKGAKRTAIDGPNMNPDPRVLGEPPPTPRSQPEKVTAGQTLGEQDPRRSGQRSSTHLGEKPTLDTERGPPGVGAFGSRGI